MVILSETLLRQCIDAPDNDDTACQLAMVDDGDAYVSLDLLHGKAPKGPVVRGVLRKGPLGNSGAALPPDVTALIYVYPSSAHQISTEGRAWVYRNSEQITLPVKIVSFDDTLFSRIRGLYETEVLAQKKVLIAGLGSGGAPIALEMAKAGVGHFILIDHDRIEIGNLARHVCGLSDLGRYKTKAVRDLIVDKNPYAVVSTYEERCSWSEVEHLRELVRSADLVYCATDNRESRLLLNHVCLAEKRVCIYGGTFIRAYGGHVLRVIPHESLCYNCFLDLLPREADNFEISSEAQAIPLQYAPGDSAIRIEPGLASDIAPMSLMAIKMGILELLRGTDTSLSSLYDDLRFPWYQWLNRRESGTEYGSLPPLDADGDTYRILAWYGIDVQKSPGCPACGDFRAEVGLRYGITVDPDAEAIFAVVNEVPARQECVSPELR